MALQRATAQEILHPRTQWTAKPARERDGEAHLRAFHHLRWHQSACQVLQHHLRTATADALLVRQGPDGRIAVARPAEVATQLNRLFQADDFSGLYFTLLYGVLHLPSGRFDYCSGGHPALVRLPAGGGDVELHTTESFPVAFVPDVEYEQKTLQLAPGDRLFLYSDGVPELRATPYTGYCSRGHHAGKAPEQQGRSLRGQAGKPRPG